MVRSAQWASCHGFLIELDRAIKRIAEAPERWPRSGQGVRRYLMPRYPYSVMYRVKAEEVEVIAVAHERRKPGYWRSR
ncbi:MAG: type II toxin-antitoxin system RelE/ParE family toxin [Candidatus Marinimicrobia bacterium]|nr:type II toxin-antitoxin system RelE/ParE family toxin [Candidatus Neomarinimicrobiota bacterium]